MSPWSRISDCVVNRGDHSPRGGTNALTVYTKRKHPLTNPTERLLHPMARDSKGGQLKQVSWDEALNRVADAIKAALDNRGPSSIGLWAADHLSPEMNFASTKLFFAPLPRGLYNPSLGPDKGVAVRAIHNRPKWNSEHPILADNFGSANSLLYSYRDYEIADTILLLGRELVRDRNGLLQPGVRSEVQEGGHRSPADRVCAERRETSEASISN